MSNNGFLVIACVVVYTVALLLFMIGSVKYGR
jgi:hypothetical protein